MGDGFATVDNRNLKNTGKSSSLNRTMAADYRLRHIPTARHGSITMSVLYTVGHSVVVHKAILPDNSNSALHITAVYLLYNQNRDLENRVWA